MRTIAAIAFLTAAALLTGCRHAASVSPRNVDEHVFLEQSVASALQVLSTHYDRSASDTVQASIAIRNNTRHTLSIQYRPTWYREDGSVITSILSLWQPASIQPDEIADVTVIAPSSQAVGFRIQFRKAP